jgi:hypothetical protein
MSQDSTAARRGQLACAPSVSPSGAMARATGGRVVGRRLPGRQGPPASPRLVTRGRLLQSDSVSSCDINPGVLVDWLAFTIAIPDVEKMQQLVYALRHKFGGGDILNQGFNGYTNSMTILGGEGRIAWHLGRVEMGVHVNLPAGALCNMELTGILDDVQEFMRWLLKIGAKFSRLDIAIDTDTVTIDQIARAVDGPELVSRCNWAMEQRRLRGAAGRTVYVGAPSSDRRVRFYDKAAEQGLEDVVWTRAEVQHRDKHAQVAAQAIADGQLDPVALFNSVLDFRDPASDSNVTRRKRCEWWAAWLGSLTDRVSFAFVRPEKSVHQVADWIGRQVASSLAMMATADPSGWKLWLTGVIDEGFDRLDPFRRQRAEQYRLMGLSLA